jgi:ketosteroid isomerase-like protein
VNRLCGIAVSKADSAIHHQAPGKFTFADSTGKVQTQFGKTVTIWRKDASGAWKCVVDTWNSSPTENVYPAV